MPSPLLQMRIRAELLDAVDAAAAEAGMDRKMWVVQALEKALGGSEAGGGSPRSAAPSPSAPSRASVPTPLPEAPVLDDQERANSIRTQRVAVQRSLLKPASAYRPIKKGSA